MSSRVRRAAVALAAGVLISGVGIHASTMTASAQDSTLRAAAESSGRFVGTAINDSLLNNSTYRAIAEREFSSVTAENAMKWESIEPNRGQYNWAGADRLMNFAAQNNQQVWGHVLVWHSQLPGWLDNGNFSGSELRSIMNNHIETFAGRYRGQVDRWEVVNEIFNEDGSFRDTIWLRGLGESYVEEAFRAARAADPNAKLFINDYNTDGINAKSDAMYRLVSNLVARGVPIDGVGFQSHMILGQVPSTYQQNLQRFADLGLEVAVTELDIRMNTPADPTRLQRQANEYASVTEACLAVSRCSGITVWGISDRDSWIPDWFQGEGAANLYDDNYQPKPAYYAMREAFGGPGGGPGGGDNGGPGGNGGNDGGDNGGPGGPGTGECTANYDVTSRWDAGSVVEVRVTTRQSLNGWQVSFDLPSGVRVTNGWNANVTQSGNRVTATNADYNGNVGANGTLQFGFMTDSGQQYSAPAVTLNGTACSAG
ncbi:endo-1,4-beta-xylanase [Streptomyces sp. IF17]|nr:endo-1,4-beta-xylanase [Streptomyces alkaliphilus]